MPRQVFDKDHSGAIDAEELQQLMFEFGMAVPESEVQAALRAIDADNSGEIDLDEFSVWWLCAPHPQIKETVTLKLLRTKLRLRQKLRNVKESFRSQHGSQRDMADVYVCVCRVDLRDLPFTNRGVVTCSASAALTASRRMKVLAASRRAPGLATVAEAPNSISRTQSDCHTHFELVPKEFTNFVSNKCEQLA